MKTFQVNKDGTTLGPKGALAPLSLKKNRILYYHYAVNIMNFRKHSSKKIIHASHCKFFLCKSMILPFLFLFLMLLDVLLIRNEYADKSY